ncbi:uncharacterized protein BO95DRAFT_100660 [Aspergillus brunneoviolaceus CBS 621.78]|uniref:Uncharacterized protein n=1 Tax=Aspergillus brunneoviolaceus CBS 621.78 TaxID=1450534 RepID=A0ACD1GBR4_9EURO|nr:hypothetical protein BO95DRAFT_100660 [Aspergillus brunneoviolaceus CBS 621.78]RAH46707.1 hypothetical protein BO95DRAFT_100660 [Aspergillus brunneoviolaceus CBS 621.78]
MIKGAETIFRPSWNSSLVCVCVCVCVCVFTANPQSLVPDPDYLFNGSRIFISPLLLNFSPLTQAVPGSVFHSHILQVRSYESWLAALCRTSPHIFDGE